MPAVFQGNPAVHRHGVLAAGAGGDLRRGERFDRLPNSADDPRGRVDGDLVERVVIVRGVDEHARGIHAELLADALPHVLQQRRLHADEIDRNEDRVLAAVFQNQDFGEERIVDGSVGLVGRDVDGRRAGAKGRRGRRNKHGGEQSHKDDRGMENRHPAA